MDQVAIFLERHRASRFSVAQPTSSGMILCNWKACRLHVANGLEDFHEAQNAVLVARRDRRLDIEQCATLLQQICGAFTARHNEIACLRRRDNQWTACEWRDTPALCVASLWLSGTDPCNQVASHVRWRRRAGDGGALTGTRSVREIRSESGSGTGVCLGVPTLAAGSVGRLSLCVLGAACFMALEARPPGNHRPRRGPRVLRCVLS